MYTQYYKQYSHALNRDMEWKVYGHAGKPVLFIPCQDGRFYDFENFKMTDFWGPYIEAGKVMVFSIDTLDVETWSNKFGDPRWRSVRHEQWMNYITEEMAPFIRQMAKMCNNLDFDPGITVFGCSLGATHAANLYYRRPDIFNGLLALSGIYTAEYGFDSYMDDLVYANSPVHYLSNLPADHPYLDLFNDGEHKAIICVGQGPWEYPDYTRDLDRILHEKGISTWVDYWGWDCAHEWPWWYRQVTYFLPHLFGSL